ncbi:MAG: isoleucine--tRNA ligase [Phycisphaerae bacterium]|nr:isoleucine--tRNA ligase [Phycisphaerae bacterium]
MTDATRPNFKKTLNLPQTSFPMRANLRENEPASEQRWEQEDVYARLLEARSDSDPFVFHDGPPYANGSIHVGHLMNKVLKDIVVRSRLLEDRSCPFVPGWDCHGLPIEHMVMTQLVEKGKMEKINGLDDDTRRMVIRRECRTYAEKHQAGQAKQMKRLLTLADYEHPYLTMNPGYEQAVLEVFADLVAEGIVYRQLKPVHWSIDNQTALAEAELEYEDRTDPSVFVDFPASDASAVASAFGVELDTTPSFLIWTTTPWTLVANMAIAVHERGRYSLVASNGATRVIASDLVETVMKTAGHEDAVVLGECDGSALIGLSYEHPYCQRTSPIVAADYVTFEDGTGLVHTAPGHGTDDYFTGIREGMDIYCPVQADGTYDETVPDWLQGMSIWEANPLVVQRLADSGHLFHHHDYEHSYPHDWRSGSPVIFRSTEQWFISVNEPTKSHGTSLREKAMATTGSDINFIPDWGRNRMQGMLESRPDWCISRQRSWGLPIPAFTMPGGEMLLTAASTRAVAEAIGERGSDAWFSETPEQLLSTWDVSGDPDAPEGVDVATLEKTYDIFDVWFESGSSWNAVMRRRGLGYPVDLYLEGSDQHRGWFQLSLLPGLGVTGQPPFKTVLTHGFVNDRQGRKMSKSQGNALDVDTLLESFGADVCRWWVSSLSYENDVRADEELFQLAGESYRKVRNTLRFLLSNLGDFDKATMGVTEVPSTSIDAWALSEASKLQHDVRAAYERCDFRRVHLALFDFCNETLSAVYCVAVKDRLYCDRADTPRRRLTQNVLHDIASMLCRLLAPILPHTADEAWRDLHGEDACVHLETFQDFSAEAEAAWPAVMAMRDAVLKALEEAKESGIEKPLDAGVRIPDPEGVLAPFEAELADLIGVSRASVDSSVDAIAIEDLREQPACERSWRRDATVSERANGSMLSDRDWEAVQACG